MNSTKHFQDDGILRKSVISFEASGFALVDGAHFDDLPATFSREGLIARSLFLDQSEIEIQRAGPWRFHDAITGQGITDFQELVAIAKECKSGP